MSAKTFSIGASLMVVVALSLGLLGYAYSVDAGDYKKKQMKHLTEAEVLKAQQKWSDGIIAISKVHSDGGDYTARATEHINDLYAYGKTNVMFKPTLASQDQFRESFEQALSYFVGEAGTEDKGFAIKGWTNIRWENHDIHTDKDSAMAMGNYYFTGVDGNVVKVEYTFGYVRGDDGKLRINLHHSSLPFSPK